MIDVFQFTLVTDAARGSIKMAYYVMAVCFLKYNNIYINDMPQTVSRKFNFANDILCGCST